MKMLLRILLGLVAVIVVLALAVAVAVAFIFEPEDYRPLIVKAVEQSTGRSFEMGGELGLKLFPCCSVEVGPSTLGNPAGFTDGHFARLDAAAFSLEIWPLLMRREVKIGQVTLDGLDLALVQLTDGRNNWTFAGAEPPPGQTAESEAAPGELSIAGLRLSRGTIHYRDESSGAAYLVRDIDLNTGGIASLLASDLVVEVESSFVAIDETDSTTATLTLTGTISLADERIEISQLQVELDASGAQIPAQRLAGVIRVHHLELMIADTLGVKAESLESELRIENLEALPADLSARVSLATMDMDVDTMSGRIAGLEASLTGLDSQVQVTGGGEFGGPASELRGAVQFSQIALRNLMNALAADDFTSRDPQALQQLSGTARWAFGDEHGSLEDLNLRLDDSQLTGSFDIRNFAAPAIRYDLVLDRIDADRYLPPADAASPAIAASEPTLLPLSALKDLNLDGKLLIRQLRASNLDLADLQLKVNEQNNQLTLSLNGQAANGSFRVEGGGDVGVPNPQLSGTLSLENLSPRQLLDASGNGVTTADPALLARLSGASRWRLGTRSIAFEQMNWQLDQTELTGSLTIDDFDTLATRFELALDRLNLDGYLAPDAEDSAAEDAAEIPVDVIRDLLLDGRLAAGELIIAELKLQNLSATVRAQDGVLRLDPLQARLYGGDYRGVITIDATGPKALLTLDQQLNSVQIAEILRGLYDSDRLGGSVSLQVSGTGAGNTQTELLKALTGNVAMSLSDGVYRGMDISYEVQRARALVRKEAAPSAPAKMETPIRALTFAGQMANGVLGTDQLSAEIPFFRLAGKGGINLLELALDYQLNAQVLKKDDTTAGQNLADLVNATIPLTIKGPLASPRVGVDMKNLVTNAVRDTLQDRAREALLKRLGGATTESPPAAQTSAPPVSAPAPDTATDLSESGPAAPVAQPTAEPSEPTPEESIPAAEPEKPKADSAKDLLKRGLRDLLTPKEPEPEK